MPETDALSQELIAATQRLADAEMRIEMAGGIMRRVALALARVQSFEMLQTFSRFIDRSIELSGLALKFIPPD